MEKTQTFRFLSLLSCISKERLFLLPQTGVGQGDVHSPHIWNLVIDILLRALEAHRSRNPHSAGIPVRSSDGLHTVSDLTYADDIISLSVSLLGLQHLANLVSLFANIFGLSISLKKLRAFYGHYSEITPAEKNPCITIYDHHWTAHVVPLRAEGTIKHLGFLHDLHGNATEQLHSTKLLVKTSINQLRQKLYLSPEAHSLALSYRLYGQLAYHIIHSSWNLAQLEALEQPINAFYRMRTRNLSTFPTHLLYAPTSHGGLGLTRLTTRCHHQRHGILHHFLNSPSTAWIVDSLIGRLFRSAHFVTTHGYSQQLNYLPEDSTDHIANPTFWARSTAQLALAHDQCLSSPGICPISTHSSVQSLWDFFPNTPEATRFRYTAAGLHSVGDIMNPNTSNFLHIPTLPPLPIAERQPPLFHNFIRTEQVWRLDSNIMFEIHSLKQHNPGEPFIHVRWWVIPTLTSKPRTASTAKHAVLHDTGFGYFDPTPYAYDQLFPPMRTPHRMILEADLNDLTGVPLPKTHKLRLAHPHQYIRLIHGEYKSHRPMIPDSLFLTTKPDQHWHLGPAADLPPGSHTTYTDGSWKRTFTDPLSDLLYPDPCLSAGGGAIVLLANDTWHQQPIHIIQLTDSASLPTLHAQTWELLALVCALQLSTILQFPIHSDCKSVVDKLNSIPELPYWRKSDHQFLFAAAKRLLSQHSSPIHWIRSHPEKRLQRHLWSQHDWGIYIADQIASKSQPPPLFISPSKVSFQLNYHIHELSVETLLQTLAKHSTYHWSSKQTRLPVLYHPKTTWPTTNMHEKKIPPPGLRFGNFNFVALAQNICVLYFKQGPYPWD